MLLDSTIATRSPGRRLDARLLHERPCARLHAAVPVPPAARRGLLRRWFGLR